MKNNYIVATIRPWHIKVYNEYISKLPGQWHLINSTNQLSIEKINAIDPKFIFFPHWSEIVPNIIVENKTCICFHETDLPYGRGGSPIQNLIIRGLKTTMITAFKMTPDLDLGPIYLKEKLFLLGSAADIYTHSADIIARMIEKIITTDIVPEKIEYNGEEMFKRRKPAESEITKDIKTLDNLYDHIRMLDAEGYPKAFINIGEFKFEFSNTSVKSKKLITTVEITKDK